MIRRKASVPARRSNLEETLALQLKMAGLMPRCTREYVFAPLRKFRFDFAFLHAMLAIECEGGSWVGGAHGRGGHFQSDCDKYNLAGESGWTVLRYTMKDIQSGVALAQIQRVLNQGEPMQNLLRYLDQT